MKHELLTHMNSFVKLPKQAGFHKGREKSVLHFIPINLSYFSYQVTVAAITLNAVTETVK